MRGTMNITIEKVKESRISQLPLDNIPFGKYFSDHMLVANFDGKEWKEAKIMPYQPLLMSPAMSALNYGQSIFEGIKAFRGKDKRPYIFRPEMNHKRFNQSASRMEMPSIPEELFLGGMRQLVAIDQQWIPDKENHALYIRPFMFATDDTLGVHPSEHYQFIIILCPVGPFFAAPMRLYVEERFTRAAPGGVGFAKAAGNYGAAMQPTALAKKKGYDQVLWTDAFEHKYIQEAGTMNVFFIIGNKVITPDLQSEVILSGVTRESAITLLKEMGLTVEERPITIDEVIAAYRNGQLLEVFGTGTAATIAMVRELNYKGTSMQFDTSGWKICTEVKRRLDAIHSGEEADVHNWMYPV